MSSIDIIEKELRELQQNYAKIDTKLERVLEDISKLFDALETRYITKEEFAPVKNLVYGLVALILATVFGALLLLVIVK